MKLGIGPPGIERWGWVPEPVQQVEQQILGLLVSGLLKIDLDVQKTAVEPIVGRRLSDGIGVAAAVGNGFVIGSHKTCCTTALSSVESFKRIERYVAHLERQRPVWARISA